VTGGNGYIAYNLIKALKNIELTITRFDSRVDKWSEFDNNCKIKFKNIEGDIRDKEILESVLLNYDIIFHFAAQTSVYISDLNPVSDININLIPLVNILDICEKKALSPIIIFSGTATEVGLNKKLFVNESVKDYPVTIYDLNKLLAETYLNYYCRKGIVKGAILRLANVYGPGPKSSAQERGVVNLMVKRAINKIPLTAYGNGEFVRDYIFIDDIINAFLTAAENIDKINGQYFYIGSGEGHSIIDMFKIIVERAFIRIGYRPNIQNIDPPENLALIEKRSFVADINKFVKYTKWQPTMDLTKGIDLTIEYFLNK
jgi:nucleoside-diphosphate-sugar epimerase